MLQRVQTSDPTIPALIARILQQIQDNVDKALTDLQGGATAASELLTNAVKNGQAKLVTLTMAQDNLISHNLGTVPKVILIGAPNVQATIWNPTTGALSGQPSSSTRINLWTSANCVVPVVVA